MLVHAVCMVPSQRRADSGGTQESTTVPLPPIWVGCRVPPTSVEAWFSEFGGGRPLAVDSGSFLQPRISVANRSVFRLMPVGNSSWK